MKARRRGQKVGLFDRNRGSLFWFGAGTLPLNSWRHLFYRGHHRAAT